MAVRTKAYTINRLISEVRSLSSRKVNNYSTFISEFSPRAGKQSTKLKVLNSFLSGSLQDVVEIGYGTGKTKTIKARVIAALQLRKSRGWF